MTVATITASVEVDVELDDIDTDDMVDELERRGVAVNGDFVESLFIALKCQGKDAVYELCRTYVQDKKGVVL